MSAHLIYAWTDNEAAALSGDPAPELCRDVPAHPSGRLPFLVDDGAITLEPAEVDYLVDIAGLITLLAVAVVAGGIGYLIGWAR